MSQGQRKERAVNRTSSTIKQQPPSGDTAVELFKQQKGRSRGDKDPTKAPASGGKKAKVTPEVTIVGHQSVLPPSHHRYHKWDKRVP